MEETISAGAAWAAVRRRLRWLSVAAVAGLLFGLAWNAVRPPQAVATSAVMFPQDPNDPKRADTEARIASSRAVVDKVAASLPGSAAGRLANDLTAAKLTHDVVRLTAQAGSTDGARKLIAAYTAAYIDYSGGLQRQSATDQAASLTRQLAPVNAQLAAVADRLNQIDTDPRVNATGPLGEAARVEQVDLQKSQERLGQDITDLQDKIAAAQVASGRQDWFTPIDQSTPIPPGRFATARRILAPTLLAPLLVALGLVLARRRDVRLYEPAQVARAAGAPVPATVPAPAPDRIPTDAEEIRWRRAVSRLLDAEAGPVPALTVVHPGGDPVAAATAGKLIGRLPVSAPPVRQVAALGGTLPDLDPAARLVLVVTAGTMTAAALHQLAGACHDAGAAPHAVLLVTPELAAAPRPARLRRASVGAPA
jgi:hypothetical protein